jgi:hypothetical protein
MSLHSITSSISQTGLLPQVNFGGSPKKKANAADTAGSDASSIGQIPVGTGQNLLANALQALQHAVGAQAGAPAATATGVSGTTNSGASRYQGSLVSSLQTLIQQQSGGAGTQATASTSQLTSFLDGLLQKLQSNGSQAPSLLGAHVNANV